MEYVIRDHSKKRGLFILIFPIDLKTEVIKMRGNYVLLYNYSNRIKWKYEFYPFYFPPSIREKIEMYSIPAVEIDFGRIIRLRRDYSLYWEEGNLIKEEYGDREIKYHGKNKIIIIHGIDYIYDLKGHLEVKGVAYMRDFYNLTPYYDELKEIEKGNLNVINSVNPNNALFYIDEDNKINVVVSRYPGISFIPESIRKNPAKLKEEAEKLRKDIRNYTPRFTKDNFSRLLFNRLLNFD